MPITRKMSFPFDKLLGCNADRCKVYRKIDLAMDFYRRNYTTKLKLFSYEGVRNGKRFFVFIVCDVEYFWNEYHKIDVRNFYEIIVQDRPCRLYFDVEFYYGFNYGLNGNAALSYFITVVCEEIRNVYGFNVSYEDVIDLDSSSSEKFSRHLIFHFPHSRFFTNNLHVGRFVSFVCEKLKKPIPSVLRSTVGCNGLIPNNGHGMVVNDKNDVVPICDLGVYTRNRNFRLFMSSKFSKPFVLRLANTCCFYEQKGISSPTREQIFRDSLICPELEGDPAITGLADTVFPTSNLLDFDELANSAVCVDEKKRQRPPSPIPQLDEFIVKLASKNVSLDRKDKTFILAWVAVSENLIIFDIGGTRFCHHIVREHRRNHVKYVVNLEKMICYQMCRDPWCHNYKSDDYSITFS